MFSANIRREMPKYPPRSTPWVIQSNRSGSFDDTPGNKTNATRSSCVPLDDLYREDTEISG